MDITIEENISRLLDSIKESEAYREFRKQEQNLNRDSELRERVDDFRKDNYRVQNECDRNELFHVAEQLARESAELRRNPEVNAYLDAELALCRMIQKICTKLADGIEFNTPNV